MSQEITFTLSAVDEASDVVNQVANNIESANVEITESTVTMSDTVEGANVNVQNTAQGFNSLAMAGMMLYMGINNIENAQVALDRAHVQVEKSTNAVTAAQLAYDKAVAEYGPNSANAQDALAKLNTAQDALTVSQERANEAQRSYDNTIIFSALTVVPNLVMAFTNLTKIGPAVDSAIDGMGDAMQFLSDNPIVLVVAAIAAVVLALIYAYEHCAPFRDAINEIGTVMKDIFVAAINLALGPIKAFEDALEAAYGVVKDVEGGIGKLGSVLSHLCFVHATPSAQEFNKTLNESIGLTDALSGKVSSLTGHLSGVAGVAGEVGGAPSGIGAMAAAGAGAKAPAITINGPLVQIQGSADKKTAELAAQMMQNKLKNVLIQPTSPETTAGHSRVRMFNP
jgi:uncharacterized glyoxalase superfamily protein PhnB